MKYVISKNVDSFFTDVSDVFGFVVRFFKEVFKPPFEFNEMIKQCYNVGVRSVALITVTGFITGLVFTKQSRPSLAEFGATSWLPSLVGIAVIKSLAPLVTALICAGKVGSGIGAELGSMKVTEQIDAMDVSGVNAFKFLVVTRIVATSICIPLLMMYAAFVSLMGSYIDIHSHENITLLTFFQNAFQKITFLDFASTLFRSVIYGFTISLVGCFKGYNTTQGTEGVGKAANMAVVVSMFLIFIEEMAIIQMVNWIR
ncbi:MlaE family ABC transporter permease [Flavisolibacter ginsengisoli]|jgi:phospholipid/cholesterol/gamma-HCH transport system permease protein|uniref:Phospholipid/cholesterol/gamma-HCH transport system permease protein n=1 Tax=Flavisolibacter ginsengisoli DSM 18119 TaxID=1121884 RepID=A0A1M5AFA7_9BACT|nr:ABC transporter permease [Flavisolibacter ginsengisoli]SHF28814.1 phospholipid/cholesterol/gamma-HCH transport system permease protein [Flavisolibacter ginsengisoli DSM 18119]